MALLKPSEMHEIMIRDAIPNINPIMLRSVEKEIKLVNLHSYTFSLDQNAAKQVIADVVYYTYQMEEEKSE